MIFSKEDYAQLLLFAGENGATEEQIEIFIQECEGLAVAAAQLELILSNTIEITGWDEDNVPIFQTRTKNPDYMALVKDAADLIIQEEE